MDIYEHAARIYCTKSGSDPDTVVGRIQNPLAPSIAEPVLLWQTVVERIRDLHLLLTSMKEAQSAPRVQATSDKH